MDEESITQVPPYVKREFSPASCAPFSKDMELLTGLSKVDSNLRDYRMSATLRNVMIEKIMESSNAQAMAVLCSVAPIGFVPGIGDNSIPLNEIATFYNVTEEYLNNMAYRTDLNKKQYPQDVSRISLSEILSAKAPIEPCCKFQQKDIDRLSTYRIKGSYCQMMVSLPTNRAFNLYSPRFVLALALMMIYTDKSQTDGNIKKTLLALKRSPYRFMGNDAKDGMKEVHGKSAALGDMRLTSTGDITVSSDVLIHVCKAAVRDGVSEAMSGPIKDTIEAVFSGFVSELRAELAGSQPEPEPKEKPKGGIHAKLSRPDNWDSILIALDTGLLTQKEAAKAAHMSLSSFRRYLKGESVFDD